MSQYVVTMQINNKTVYKAMCQQPKSQATESNS